MKNLVAKMNKVKALRLSTGLTQKEFSEKYKIPQRTLENWEQDKYDIKPYQYEWLKAYVEKDLLNEENAKK